MRFVFGLLLICVTLVVTGCSPEPEETNHSPGESSETSDFSGGTEAYSDGSGATFLRPDSPETEQPEKEKEVLPPFDAEKMAQNLKAAGAVFAHIENGELTKVNFFRSKQTVTDATIALLVDEHDRTPEHLVELNLFGANLTDESLKILARIPSLESLNLNNVSGGMTNQGIAALIEKLPNLKFLGLSDSRITNDGLKPVGSLENLNQIVLSRTEIGDEGLAHLKDLKNMDTMNLMGTKVNDEGLVHLTNLPKLKHLTLSSTEITGAGAVEHLKKMTKLEYLRVPRANFENQHYDALKAANPKLWK